MKTLQKALILATVIAVLFALPFSVYAKAQETCPLMGGKINKNIYVDHGGKRVYFCCQGCVAPFKKDPDKYVKKLESEGVELEKVPETGEKK